jgi:hypothetical protein
MTMCNYNLKKVLRLGIPFQSPCKCFLPNTYLDSHRTKSFCVEKISIFLRTSLISGYPIHRGKNFLLQKSTYSRGNLFEYVFHKFFDCIGIQLGTQMFQCQRSLCGSLALNTEGKRSTFL